MFRIVNEHSRQKVDNPAFRAIAQGRIVGLANHTVLLSQSGQEWPIDDSAAPIFGTAGDVQGAILVFREISDASDKNWSYKCNRRHWRKQTSARTNFWRRWPTNCAILGPHLQRATTLALCGEQSS